MLKNRLPFEIAVIIVAKLLALTVLYFAFFSPAHRTVADSRAVAMRVLGSGSHP